MAPESILCLCSHADDCIKLAFNFTRVFFSIFCWKKSFSSGSQFSLKKCHKVALLTQDNVGYLAILTIITVPWNKQQGWRPCWWPWFFLCLIIKNETMCHFWVTELKPQRRKQLFSTLLQQLFGWACEGQHHVIWKDVKAENTLWFSLVSDSRWTNPFINPHL